MTSSKSSTGARGPTGPSGQARSSPAGNKGGTAGSVSRSSGVSPKSSSGGARGPTGPQGQPRTSPAGSRSGAPGSVVRGDKATGYRGPTGPLGQGRISPTGQKPGAGIKRSAWNVPVSPMDKRTRVGQEPTRYDQRSVSEAYRESQKNKKAASEKAGVKFGPPVGIQDKRGKPSTLSEGLESAWNHLKTAPGFVREHTVQTFKNMNPNEFRGYVSESLPAAKLSGSLRGQFPKPSGPRSRSPMESGSLFSHGGVVKKSKPRKK
jgi:hypothetical protein